MGPVSVAPVLVSGLWWTQGRKACLIPAFLLAHLGGVVVFLPGVITGSTCGEAATARQLAEVRPHASQPARSFLR
jgi:hypothetical protein